MVTTPTDALRRARLATFALFGLNGFVLGVWIVNIPAIRDRAGIDDEVLGYLLLLLGGSAIVGMQLGGRAVDRFGSGRVSVVAAAVFSVLAIGPGLVTTGWELALALVLMGAFNGTIDVAQNAHGVEIERAYGRPILSAFHALFSFGGLLASVLGGALIAADLPPVVALASAAVIGLVVVAVAIRPHVLAHDRAPLEHDEPVRRRPPWTPQVALIAALAFALLLSEGVAYDWSTVHVRDYLDASGSTAAWAFGAFSATMTAVRLVADRVVARIGPAAYVQVAALVGAAGLSGAALAPTPVVAIVAWGVFGIGLAGCVPQFFSAAGNVDPRNAGVYLARVTGLGYFGLLAGPGFIGLLTRWVPLTTAFVLPIVGCLLAGLLARVALRPKETA